MLKMRDRFDVLLEGLLLHKLLGNNRGLLNQGLWVQKNVQLKAEASKESSQDKSGKQKEAAANKKETQLYQPKNLDGIKTLAALKEELAKVDHPLRYLATQLVFSSDPDNENPTKIMVIGEAPGEEEDKQGLPFVGASGQLLEQALSAIDLKRNKDFYVTNIVPFRPPANRTPIPAEIEFFKPFIAKHVELVAPKLLILVGSTAYKAFFKDAQPITKIRGSFLAWNNIPVLIVLHPSYLLRVPSAKQTMWHDMIKLKMFLQEASEK